MDYQTGKIYILRNSSFNPNIIKIGKTKRTSEIRSRELSISTGVPTGFEVLYEDEVIDHHLAEKLIHKYLQEYRINPKREFFNLALKDAVKIVFNVCQDINNFYEKGASSRIALFVKNDPPKDLLPSLKKLMKNHVGGETEVIIFYKYDDDKHISISLGYKSRVSISKELLLSLGKINGITSYFVQ